MAEVAPPRTVTAEELPYAAPEEGLCELVAGEIVREPPPGEEHGWIAGNAFLPLARYVREHRLGRVYAAETGFVLARQPDTVRAPDAAFVAAERLVATGRRGPYFDGAPDLAVEVVSPGNSGRALERKVEDFLAAGCRAVWVVDPGRRAVTVHASGTTPEVLAEGDVLTADTGLPGFHLPASELFTG